MSSGTAALPLLAVASAAAAVALLLPAPTRIAHAGPVVSTRHAARLLAVVPVAVLALGGVRLALLALLVAAASAAGARLWRARRARLASAATGTRVLEACETLAAELGAGRTPTSALDHATDEWPELAPVSEAHRVGADVPSAWRVLAKRPGAHDLRVVAAAWEVSHRTGEGLADTLDRVAAGLRDAHATRRVVDGELASARATAKLVAALPVLALGMGSGAGGDPWGFLLGHPVGLACLGLGLTFALAGLAWIEALAREVDRG